MCKTISAEKRERLGWAKNINPHYQLTLGKSYVVYGVTFLLRGSDQKFLWSVFDVVDDQDRFASAPSCLFEVQEATVSSLWNMQISDDKVLLGFAMPSKESTFTLLAEGDQETIRDFKPIKTQIENEAQIAFQKHGKAEGVWPII